MRRRLRVRVVLELLGVAALIAVLAASMRLLRYPFWLGEWDVEIYVLLIGGPLLVAGVLVGRFLHSARGRRRLPTASVLTDREIEVLAEVAAGYSNKEIAKRLFLSVDTVKSHLKNVYAKLGVERRTQAVEKGRSLGLLP